LTDKFGKIFDINELVSYFKDKSGEYFIDFLKIRHLEAGLIYLRPGQDDTQSAHDQDELYYVIEGSGMLQIGKNNSNVKPGSIVFVPRGTEHHFFGNERELIVLYVFAE
jgi:mannose-6-phosphate isomerase-like protein (cupin superfamily)